MIRAAYHIAGVALILDYCARVYVVTALAANVVFDTPLTPRDLSAALLLAVFLQLRTDEAQRLNRAHETSNP